jgi:hypothetical protein
VSHARSSGADDTVLEHLEALPDHSHDGPDQVSKAYSDT